MSLDRLRSPYWHGTLVLPTLTAASLDRKRAQPGMIRRVMV
jgi:hypothetical protein